MLPPHREVQMVLQNPFQFNLVEKFLIHLFKKILLNMYCMPRTKLDISNRVVNKPAMVLVQMESTLKQGSEQEMK